MAPENAFSAHLYESTGRAIVVTTASMVSVVKGFKRLYLLNLWMEVFHTWPDVRFWSEVLSPTHMNDPEVKVTDLEKKYAKIFG